MHGTQTEHNPAATAVVIPDGAIFNRNATVTPAQLAPDSYLSPALAAASNGGEWCVSKIRQCPRDCFLQLVKSLSGAHDGKAGIAIPKDRLEVDCFTLAGRLNYTCKCRLLSLNGRIARPATLTVGRRTTIEPSLCHPHHGRVANCYAWHYVARTPRARCVHTVASDGDILDRAVGVCRSPRWIRIRPECSASCGSRAG